MCGVIGLTSKEHRSDLGRVAAELLKTLEYRGYDSTGAAFQGTGTDIVLLKGVGAPSLMVDKLDIVGQQGSIMCGQVRWATFGSVDDINAQPHEVRCKTHMYGAHNGNVTNSDDLKAWLTSDGHDVLSDNDGEMVVHTVEHFFARELRKGATHEERRSAMRRAIVTAGEKLRGSYAAVVVDPVSRTLWAIKQGSSLYFGIGRNDESGPFAIASSDLSSVLKLTRILMPMSEGEFIEYTAESYQLYAIRDHGSVRAGDPLQRQPARSRLQAKDAGLMPQFGSFMEQEIDAQEETCRRIAALFGGGSIESRGVTPLAAKLTEAERKSIDASARALRDEFDERRIAERFHELVASAPWRKLFGSLTDELRVRLRHTAESEMVSQDSALFAELATTAKNEDERISARLLDVFAEQEELREFNAASSALIAACRKAIEKGGRIFVVCCGSSYHAALAGAVFFNELARAEIVPVLPGEFRGRFAASLRPTDVVIAVSQSGETKDLIDVMNVVIATRLPIRRIGIVNNVSSTLGQEKCEIVLPLRCGPEIAVPATKSYMNQLAMLYCLAIELGRARVTDLPAPQREDLIAELQRRHETLKDLPHLVRQTLRSTGEQVEAAAEMLYLEPSMHILATRILAVAKEGALKIREVVLNHTEGYEASEFKHGPNTILGVNTVFGIDDVLRFAEAAKRSARLTPETFRKLYSDYPLIFVTGPDETDVNLTVSQVNTHKIRGATCVMIAEEDAALRQAIEKPPTDNPNYRAVYITLPPTGDNLMVIFSATVVLQWLALRMSERKQQYLDRLGFADHGVHPDVPKNVSKSITVD